MSATTPRQLLIRGATILSMDDHVGDIDRGDILVDGAVINAVGTHVDATGPVEEIDATGCIVIPGMIDTHRHMWEAVLRGSAPHHTINDYFAHVLGEVGPAITAEDAYVGDLLSALAGLESGVTTIQDISNIQASPEHTDAVIQALRDSGLRAVFCYAKCLPQMFAEGTALPDDVRRVRSEVLSDSQALVTMALGTEPGGSDDQERHNDRLARELDLLTARHCSDEYPVIRMKELGVLRPGTTFIHGNGLDHDELRTIADSGSSLSIAPTIEMIMGHGYPWYGKAVEAGVPINLSVDIESTLSSDMFGQMRTLYQTARHRQVSASGPPITVHDILRFATRSGAEALGLSDRTGSISPGKQADLVILRADRVGVAPVYDPYSTVVLQMDRSNVDTVLVAGKPVKREGRLLTDVTSLLDRARRVAERLMAAGVIRINP